MNFLLTNYINKVRSEFSKKNGWGNTQGLMHNKAQKRLNAASLGDVIVRISPCRAYDYYK